MRIIKKFQGTIPENKIMSTESDSQTDTYSCDYINKIKGSGGGDSLPIGTMLPIGTTDGNHIPTNWLICDGKEVSRTAYKKLFEVIGTSYGEGDGLTTFNLPDKRGRVSVGLDSSQTEFDTLGKKDGEKNHTLTIAEMPGHTHQVGYDLDGAYDARGYVYSVHSGGVSGANAQAPTSGVGGNQPHNNLQPYEVDNWIIKALESVSQVTEESIASLSNEYTESVEKMYSCDFINRTKEERQLIVDYEGKPNSGTFIIGDLHLDMNYDYDYVITVISSTQTGFKLSYNSDDTSSYYYQNHIDCTTGSWLPAVHRGDESAKRIGVSGDKPSFIDGVIRRSETRILNNFNCCNLNPDWNRISLGLQAYVNAPDVLTSLKFSTDGGTITYLRVKLYRRGA